LHYNKVTESEIMENLALVLQRIRALRAADVCFSVDDFGTGYSSLAQLQQLPVSELKIDRSFLRDIDRSVKGAAIVQAVVQLGHSLGLKVVAEGIETESVWQVVQRMDCDIAQGYFLDQADARRSIPCMAWDITIWGKSTPPTNPDLVPIARSRQDAWLTIVIYG
jgi:EAL domain-containing protein (putative c-di-GMP-specific phosphodiesterase class I)